MGLVPLFLLCLGSALAQVSVHDAGGPRAIDGPWQMQEGDCSVPTVTRYLHDSVPADQSAKVLWLRIILQVSDKIEAPGLLISPWADECQVYLDGALAAQCRGLFGPSATAHRGLLIGLGKFAPGRPVAIAIRMVNPRPVPSGSLGLGAGDVLVGEAGVLKDVRNARDAERFYSLLPQALLCLGELAGGFVLLALYLQDRRRREYLWFVVFLWLDGSCSLWSVFARVYPITPPAFTLFLDDLGMITRYAPLIGFLAAFTGVRITRSIRAYQWTLVAIPFVLAAPFMSASLSAHYEAGWRALLLLAQLPFVVGSLIFLFWNWRRGNREAGLLIPPFLLANGIEMVGVLGVAFARVSLGRFSFNWDDLSMFFFLVSIGPVMLVRHRQIYEEHARATAELNAAREIQRQLVPAQLPEIAGCRVEAAYLPADEVGGDFYQILPQQDGSTYVAVGDVSGKGLKAAMTGALVIGALRTLCSEMLSTAAILERLNDELARAGNGGFVTCVCARIAADGTVQLANAGHLPPFLNGTEVQSPGALPLGIASGNRYEELTVPVHSGDRLIFLTDGVPEAQNHRRELFGFTRLAEVADLPAAEIADRARNFGQTDDITVLMLSPVAAPAGEHRPRLSL